MLGEGGRGKCGDAQGKSGGGITGPLAWPRAQGAAKVESPDRYAHRRLELLYECGVVEPFGRLPARVGHAHARPMHEVALAALEAPLRQDAVGRLVAHIRLGDSAGAGALLGLLGVGDARLEQLPVLPLLLELGHRARRHVLR